ncbi:hypothetical protein B0T16DRAFT_135209 [Cercophora newfieldiana]|uniref:Uncharacterized protein n=1 Tax=Cercophora newfieldiana TaxID=92897 RepID=A0AA40CUM8_9PEZI|nr:hypothetical protein B0T16DRAFT_135209 [Cercophora newfieldiana]
MLSIASALCPGSSRQAIQSVHSGPFQVPDLARPHTAAPLQSKEQATSVTALVGRNRLPVEPRPGQVSGALSWPGRVCDADCKSATPSRQGAQAPRSAIRDADLPAQDEAPPIHAVWLALSGSPLGDGFARLGSKLQVLRPLALAKLRCYASAQPRSRFVSISRHGCPPASPSGSHQFVSSETFSPSPTNHQPTCSVPAFTTRCSLTPAPPVQYLIITTTLCVRLSKRRSNGQERPR